MPQTDASLESELLPKSWVLAEILGFDGRTGVPVRGGALTHVGLEKFGFVEFQATLQKCLDRLRAVLLKN